MNSREKIINELRFQLYSKEVTDEHYPVQLSASDATAILALLKEREPVKTEPVRFKIVRAGGSNYPFFDCVCDGCGFKTSEVHTNWRFCPECGQAVKWDE